MHGQEFEKQVIDGHYYTPYITLSRLSVFRPYIILSALVFPKESWTNLHWFKQTFLFFPRDYISHYIVSMARRCGTWACNSDIFTRNLCLIATLLSSMDTIRFYRIYYISHFGVCNCVYAAQFLFMIRWQVLQNAVSILLSKSHTPKW